MWNFPGKFNIDGFSFWIGFLAGCAFWVIYRVIRVWILKQRERDQNQIKQKHHPQISGDILRLENDILLQAESWHIAAAMFSLDEIMVEPRLLAPPLSPITNPTISSTDVTDWAIPYMPDWPEMASVFGAPTLSLAEALLGGCNLAITGQPGSGKTVALASLAIQMIRNTTAHQEIDRLTPLLLHVGNLDITSFRIQELLLPVQQAVMEIVSAGTRKRLVETLPALFENGKAFFILDGLDELPPAQVDPYIEYLSAIKEAYPKLRMAVSASLDYMGGLFALDFFPFSLAEWSLARRLEFTHRWSNAWTRFIIGSKNASQNTAEPWLLQGWLANQLYHHSPLEITLRTWAAFAGDALGAKPYEAIEAHLRRLTFDLPPRVRPALEQMALQIVRYMQPLPRRADAENWISGSLSTSSATEAWENEGSANLQARGNAKKDAIKAPGSLPALIEQGIIKLYAGDRIGICHPAIAGYLAGEALLRIGDGTQLVMQPDWCGKSLALERFCSQATETDFIHGMIRTEKEDVLLKGILSTSRWLRNAPDHSIWANSVMSQLASCLQNENLALSLKGKLLTALVLSGKSSVQVLFRKMIEAPHAEILQLGALGCGMLRDQRSSQQIIKLLSNRSPHVRGAAVLALVAIHDRDSLKALAEALLQGDVDLRRACAEGLANDPDEGHPTLRDGSSHPDALVRRSVVFGLRRIRQDWVYELLESMREKDPQWVVQDAAAQVLAEYEQLDARIPQPLPAPTLAPWLISFAADRNMVVPSGKAGYELIHRSLKEGSEDKIQSSLYYLGFKGIENSILPIYRVYYSSKGEKRELALSALQNLASSGLSLPSPAYLGLV